MFTGIIEEIGKVEQVQKGAKSSRLVIYAQKIMDDLKHGDSIATDGVCLTVCERSTSTFSVDVMATTLQHSTLGNLQTGDSLNLERALRLDTRMGGHIVLGHVDCHATIIQTYQEDIAHWVEIEVPPQSMKYLIDKGSVCVDGISLTVAKLTDKSFFVSTIPVTQKDTTLAQKKKGQQVNIEWDVLAKYTERLLGFRKAEASATIGMEFLQQNGFA